MEAEMASKVPEVNAEELVQVPESQEKPVEMPAERRYIAKENCFFEGRYLKRGEIILLQEKPDHDALAEYTDAGERDTVKAYYDPLTSMLSERRIKAAMPSAYIR